MSLHRLILTYTRLPLWAKGLVQRVHVAAESGSPGLQGLSALDGLPAEVDQFLRDEEASPEAVQEEFAQKLAEDRGDKSAVATMPLNPKLAYLADQGLLEKDAILLAALELSQRSGADGTLTTSDIEKLLEAGGRGKKRHRGQVDNMSTKSKTPAFVFEDGSRSVFKLTAAGRDAAEKLKREAVTAA